MNLRIWAAALVLIGGCKTVVTTTTEVRPSRYAATEFTRPVARDSIVSYAVNALQAENLKVQKVDRSAGSIVAGPVKMPASEGLPALDALLTISISGTGTESTVRIVASSVVAPNETGGTDARLQAIIQRVQNRLDLLMGR